MRRCVYDKRPVSERAVHLVIHCIILCCPMCRHSGNSMHALACCWQVSHSQPSTVLLLHQHKVAALRWRMVRAQLLQLLWRVGWTAWAPPAVVWSMLWAGHACGAGVGKGCWSGLDLACFEVLELAFGLDNSNRAGWDLLWTYPWRGRRSCAWRHLIAQEAGGLLGASSGAPPHAAPPHAGVQAQTGGQRPWQMLQRHERGQAAEAACEKVHAHMVQQAPSKIAEVHH